ncbi:hypothetical protein [Streptomyces griseus]|uniref:hypothetical protein n=1 Tax=Streptomyces griseus TaxID=1911 RepID=UPI0036C9FB30
MNGLVALLRDSLPEFFGSLSAAAVTTAVAAALRSARTARLRRGPAPTEPTPPPE